MFIYFVHTLVYTMDMNKIKRRKEKGKGKRDKTVRISVRLTPALSKWLKEKDYSPTGIFYEAVKEIGYKE